MGIVSKMHHGVRVHELASCCTRLVFKHLDLYNFLWPVTKKNITRGENITKMETLFWILNSLNILYTRNMKLAYGERSLISLIVDRKSPSQMHHVALSFELLNLFVN